MLKIKKGGGFIPQADQLPPLLLKLHEMLPLTTKIDCIIMKNKNKKVDEVEHISHIPAPANQI